MMTAEMQADQAMLPLEIQGDVGPSTGHVESRQDVIVHGGVTDSMLVRSAGSATIHGSVDGAEIHAGRDIVIGGGAVGKDKCRCIAGGDISVRHVNGAFLQADNNITIASNAAQARIICGGRLQVPEGSLLGGHVTATGGVACKTLGSAGGAATLIEAGIDEGLRQLAAACLADLETKVAHLERLKTALAPLIRNQKGLTAREKERATELMYEAQELEEVVEQSLAELRRKCDQAQARSKPEILVSGIVYSGVLLRLGMLEARIQTAAKGPLVLTQGRVGGLSTIVLIESDTGACHPLATTPFRDVALERLNRILLKQD
jgi:uncharacterized protein (DUF342 family)